MPFPAVLVSTIVGFAADESLGYLEIVGSRWLAARRAAGRILPRIRMTGELLQSRIGAALVIASAGDHRRR